MDDLSFDDMQGNENASHEEGNDVGHEQQDDDNLNDNFLEKNEENNENMFDDSNNNNNEGLDQEGHLEGDEEGNDGHLDGNEEGHLDGEEGIFEGDERHLQGNIEGNERNIGDLEEVLDGDINDKENEADQAALRNPDGDAQENDEEGIKKEEIKLDKVVMNDQEDTELFKGGYEVYEEKIVVATKIISEEEVKETTSFIKSNKVAERR